MPTPISMDEQFLQRLILAIDAHLADENFGVNQLASELGMSRTTLHRKVKEVVKKSVSAFIRETRLQRACELLQSKSGTVAEIAYQVGFGSPTYFSKCFHDFYGITPNEVLKGNYPDEPSKVAKKLFLKNKKWIYVFVALVSVLLLFFVFRTVIYFEKQELQKITIAILPLEEYSQHEDSLGVLPALRYYLHNSMGNINQLNVRSYLSTDKYSYSNKNLKEIAREVNSDFILSVKANVYKSPFEVITILDNGRTGNQISTHKYLLDKGGKNLDLIARQIVTTTAKNLKVKLSEDEEKQLKKVLSKNEAALRHYYAGIGLSDFAKQKKHSPLWKQVINEFKTAVALDTSFAEAWFMLARIYAYEEILPNRYTEEFFSLNNFKNREDTIRMMLNRARIYGKSDKVLDRFVNSLYSNKSFEETELALNPMETIDYYRAAGILAYLKEDYYHAIKNMISFHQSIEGLKLAEITELHILIAVCGTSGFYELAEKLAREALEKTRDTLQYRYSMIPATAGRGMENLRDLLEQFYIYDSTNVVFVGFLANVCLFQGDTERAYRLMKRRTELFKLQNREEGPQIYLASLYALHGEEKKKNRQCEKIMENRTVLNDSFPSPLKSRLCNQLAAAYTLMGKKDSALMCFEKVAQLKTLPIESIQQLEFMQKFEILRNDDQFQRYFQEITSHFKAEKEKINLLLIEKELKDS